MGSRRGNIYRRRWIEPATVAFTSLEPAWAFAAIMVLAPFLLPLVLAVSPTTENPKTQPERRCRLVVLGWRTIGFINVGRIAWSICARLHVPRGIPVKLIRLGIPTAAIISTACTQARQNHYQM
jgi:hypothetical protein